MKKYLIKDKNGKTMAEVFCYLEKSGKNGKEFVDSILKEIPFKRSIGYAGYKSKNFLRKVILRSDKYENKRVWLKIKEEDIILPIRETLESCIPVITNRIYFFIFPTLNDFVIKKMNGVDGFSPWKNTIILKWYATKGWQKALKAAAAHELAHALALNYNERKTLQDNLVFEGMAEHLREHFISKGKASWVKSISKKQVILIFNNIKKYLNSRSDKLYRELFFGAGKYPLWTGYAIGYYVVNAYLKKQDNIDWKRIIKISPNKIIQSFLEQNI